jgi:hypothetical protein
MLYVTDKFSINMLPQTPFCVIDFHKLTIQRAREFLSSRPFRSYIEHSEIANIASQILGVQLEVNREPLTLQEDDFVIVVQYHGPRLPEGSTQLPEGAQIELWLLDVFYVEKSEEAADKWSSTIYLKGRTM